jgi:hypothetical protein
MVMDRAALFFFRKIMAAALIPKQFYLSACMNAYQEYLTRSLHLIGPCSYCFFMNYDDVLATASPCVAVSAACIDQIILLSYARGSIPLHSHYILEIISTRMLGWVMCHTYM